MCVWLARCLGRGQRPVKYSECQRAEAITLKSKAPHPPHKRTRLTAVRRKLLVADYVQVYGTSNASQIEAMIRKDHKIAVDRHSIANDLNERTADGEAWVRDLARTTWIQKTQQMYVETNQEIAELKGLISLALANDDIMPTEVYEVLVKNLTGKEGAKMLADIQKKLTGASRLKMMGKIAYLHSIITEKRAFLAKLISDEPLYQQTQSLAMYYEQHQQTQPIERPV